MSYFQEIKEYYKLTPRDLSERSLKKLRITSSIGLLAIIMGLLMIWSIIPFNVFTAIILALGLIISLFALGHRLPNLLSTSETHLDEWGGNAKKDAEAFTYRILFYASILSFVLGYAFLNVDTPELRFVFAPSFNQLGGTLMLLAPLLKLITTNRLAWSIQSLSEEDALEMDEIETRKDKGKWMFIVIFCIVFTAIFGGGLLGKKYASLAENAPQNCTISITDTSPVAQVRPLGGCE